MDKKRFRLNRRYWLPAIMLLAVLIRFTAAVYLGDTVEGAQQVRAFDQHSYNALAQSLLAGRGYSFLKDWYPGFTSANTPTAHWSFLYPLYLAGVYALVGVRPLAARLLQVLIVGILQTWLVYRLGRALFSENVGLLAALLSAVYLYFVFYDATLMTEPFFICAVLAILLLGLRIAGMAKDYLPQNQKASGVGKLPTGKLSTRWLGDWALLGVLAGLAALLRQTILFWLPFELLWIGWAFWYKRRQSGSSAGWQRRRQIADRQIAELIGSVLTVIVVGLFILPWTVRNYIVYKAFLPLNSNAGYALYSANHPDHGTHFDQDYAAPLPEDLLGKGLNEAQWNTALTRRGFEFILQDPRRYLLLTLSKAGVQFNFWFSSESSLSANLLRVFSFGIYLPFFIAGLVLAWREWWRVSLIYLFVLVFNLLHILTWAGIRYRLPVDAALIPFASLALLTGYEKLRHWLKNRRFRKPAPQAS